MERATKPMRAKMQRQANEMNTENPKTDDNEISAQKLCAGMMSI
jgi:hypothetical protein